MRVISCCVSFAFVLATTLGGSAHDLWGLGHKSIRVSNRLNHARLQQLSQTFPDDGTRYVIARLLLWIPGQKLRACFLNGSDKEKSFVVTSANELLEGQNVNISFDFGSVPFHVCDNTWPRADVRVSFEHGCCAAYVGAQAHDPDAQDEPSVVLEGILRNGPEKSSQIVKHELLHVLGFEHEHQAPDSLCATEFFKEAVMAAYDWDEPTYKTNIAQLDRDRSRYLWSPYDSKSIMKYYFSPDLLRNGRCSPCYTGENYVPSDRDYEGLREVYSMKPRPVSVEKTRAALATIAGSHVPQAAADLARELEKMRR